jgi:hypothetical protein
LPGPKWEPGHGCNGVGWWILGHGREVSCLLRPGSHDLVQRQGRYLASTWVSSRCRNRSRRPAPFRCPAPFRYPGSSLPVRTGSHAASVRPVVGRRKPAAGRRVRWCRRPGVDSQKGPVGRRRPAASGFAPRGPPAGAVPGIHGTRLQCLRRIFPDRRPRRCPPTPFRCPGGPSARCPPDCRPAGRRPPPYRRTRAAPQTQVATQLRAAPCRAGTVPVLRPDQLSRGRRRARCGPGGRGSRRCRSPQLTPGLVPRPPATLTVRRSRIRPRCPVPRCPVRGATAAAGIP